MRVLIAGSVTRDLNVVDGVVHRALGGTVLYAARTYCALGIDTRVVTSAASQDLREVRDAFPASTELVLSTADATTAFENSYSDHGSRTQRAPALAPPLARYDECFAGIDFVHLGPLHPDDLDDDWYRCRGAAHALDLQGLTRRIVAARVEAAADPRIPRILPACGWLKGSVREWALVAPMAREVRYAAGAERLVTRGIEGGEVIAADGAHPWRADPPVDPCDPTGAGDVHFAAYLGHRAMGDGPPAAAAAAARFTSRFLSTRD